MPSQPFSASSSTCGEHDEAVGEVGVVHERLLALVRTNASPSAFATVVKAGARLVRRRLAPRDRAEARRAVGRPEVRERRARLLRRAELDDARAVRAGPREAERSRRVGRAELLFEQHERDEAEPLAADRLWQREQAEADLVRRLAHVARHRAELFELADARRERGLGELRDAVAHEPLVFGGLEVDHGAPGLRCVR